MTQIDWAAVLFSARVISGKARLTMVPSSTAKKMPRMITSSARWRSGGGRPSCAGVADGSGEQGGVRGKLGGRRQLQERSAVHPKRAREIGCSRTDGWRNDVRGASNLSNLGDAGCNLTARSIFLPLSRQTTRHSPPNRQNRLIREPFSLRRLDSDIPSKNPGLHWANRGFSSLAADADAPYFMPNWLLAEVRQLSLLAPLRLSQRSAAAL